MMIDAPSYESAKQKTGKPDEEKGVELTDAVAQDILRKLGASKQ